MSDLTLALPGGSLATPMEDAPTVVIPAVGDNPSVLKWQTDYRVELILPGGAFVFASVMRTTHPLPEPWSAYMAVNAEESFKAWFETAAEARAAVEERIAAYVEQALAGAGPHE